MFRISCRSSVLHPSLRPSMPQFDPSDLITISEAASAKDCSRTTLYRAIDDGRLNAVEIGDRQMLVRDQVYDAFEPKWKGERVRRHRDDDPQSPS